MSFTPRDNVDHPVSPYQVDIDVVHRKLAYKDEKKVSRESLTFAQLFFSTLDETDFEFLWKDLPPLLSPAQRGKAQTLGEDR